jgi:hypothetical protein
MHTQTLIRVIAGEVARLTPTAEPITNDAVARLDQIASDLLPSGSGIDSGTTIDILRSYPWRIILHTSFHHMNEYGCYTEWTEHEIVVTPTFIGRMDVVVKGRNHNGIKDYLGELFHYTLELTVKGIWEDDTVTYCLADAEKDVDHVV